MKPDMDLIKFVMQRNEIDVQKVNSVIQDIEQELKMQQEENPPAPRTPKQHVIIVSRPDGESMPMDLTGWVVQIPEEQSPLTVMDGIYQAAYDFNTTPKGRRMPVKTVGEACEAVSARIFKDRDTWVKTKEPVLVIQTDNKIPLDG